MSISEETDPENLLDPKALQQAFIEFITSHPPRRVNKNLRAMLLEFLMQEETMECDYLHDLLFDLQGLFTLLDIAENTKFPGNKIL